MGVAPLAAHKRAHIAIAVLEAEHDRHGRARQHAHVGDDAADQVGRRDVVGQVEQGEILVSGELTVAERRVAGRCQVKWIAQLVVDQRVRLHLLAEFVRLTTNLK